jgi:hypothetical protein
MTTATIQDISDALNAPIDKRHIKSLKKGCINLNYLPWAVLCKCLHNRCAGWSFELLEVKTIGDWVVVSGRLKIPSAEGFVTYDAVSSESINTKGAPPVETAASSCLRRACALAGLGLDLWLDS